MLDEVVTRRILPSPARRPAAPDACCPFCASSVTAPWCRTRDESGADYSVRMCGACATVFLWPAPSAEVLNRAYTRDYYGEGETKFNPAVERFRDCFSTIRARRLAGNLPAGARILDIGCGDGRLLRELGKIGRYELHGIELPGSAAERAAGTPGIQLHLGALEAIELPAASFDLITLVHVFEHLPAPRDVLNRLASLLRPGARLFLALPNIDSWQARTWHGSWFHLDPPRHLALVPPPVISAHLGSMGFRLLKARHLCLEESIYGWLQSAFNACDPCRNFLYERLKRNRAYAPARGRGSVALQVGAAGLLLAPALVTELGAALARSGATVELTFTGPAAR